LTISERCSGSAPAVKCLVQDAVLSDAVDGDAETAHLTLKVDLADRGLRDGGSFGDQYVPVRALRPCGLAMLQPGPQCVQGDVAESLGVPGKGDAVVGQIEVVEGELPDRLGAGGA
jgi:hypothetical protein